jgi:uncharacterized lipoprotein YehR (DUF1307 family)
MKKIMILAVALFVAFSLNACGSSIPKDATVGVCPGKSQTVKYVFKDKTIYEFYVDEVKQTDSITNQAQTEADSYDSVQAYLNSLPEVCTFSPYDSDLNVKG